MSQENTIIDEQTGELLGDSLQRPISGALAQPDAQAALFGAWAQYCERPIPASLDSKGLYGLFPSYESVLVCFQERSKGLALGVFQRARAQESVVFIETVITHSSGGSFSTGEVAIPVNANKQGDRKPADFAASYSWAKRISLLIGCFTPSADPDDNNRPVERVSKPLAPFAPVAPAPKPVPISEQFAAITNLEELGILRNSFASKFSGDGEKLERLDALYSARKLELESAEQAAPESLGTPEE
jgi:hypothetical protein